MRPSFNIAGPCIPGEHYMLPPERRLERVLELIEGRRFFTLHAGRQTTGARMRITMSRPLLRPLLLSCSMVALVCAPTFAPPVRTIHGGAPGRLDAGQMEVGGGSLGLGAVPGGIGGGGGLGYAVRPHLVVEGGVDGASEWTLGWGGVRVPHRWRTSHRWLSFAADGSVSVGAGVGGHNCAHATTDDPATDDSCQSDGLEWYRRLAGGGAIGAGAAMRLGPVSLFSRGRLQITGARNVPATQWASGMGGLHVHILRHADLWWSMGVAHYANAADSAWGPVSEVGLAFRFDPVLGWR